MCNINKLGLLSLLTVAYYFNANAMDTKTGIKKETINKTYDQDDNKNGDQKNTPVLTITEKILAILNKIKALQAIIKKNDDLIDKSKKKLAKIPVIDNMTELEDYEKKSIQDSRNLLLKNIVHTQRANKILLNKVDKLDRQIMCLNQPRSSSNNFARLENSGDRLEKQTTKLISETEIIVN